MGQALSAKQVVRYREDGFLCPLSELSTLEARDSCAKIEAFEASQRQPLGHRLGQLPHTSHRSAANVLSNGQQAGVDVDAARVVPLVVRAGEFSLRHALYHWAPGAGSWGRGAESGMVRGSPLFATWSRIVSQPRSRSTPCQSTGARPSGAAPPCGGREDERPIGFAERGQQAGLPGRRTMMATLTADPPRRVQAREGLGGWSGARPPVQASLLWGVALTGRLRRLNLQRRHLAGPHESDAPTERASGVLERDREGAMCSRYELLHRTTHQRSAR